MNNEDVIKVLNDLIQTSEDGKVGFAEAAKNVTTTELRNIFRQRSADCSGAATELQNLVVMLGGKAKESGTVAGAAHRGWAKVKATVGDANMATLEEIERAEDEAKAVYTKALTATLPSQVGVVVQRQHDGAVRNHDLIRDLRNTYKVAKETHAH